jgi:hypothetical protein
MSLRWRAAMSDPQIHAKVWRFGYQWLCASLRRRMQGCATPVWMPVDAAETA